MRLGRQRGAVGLSAVLLLLSVLLLAAVAIDTARLFLAQRELQTQADLAALAMSRGVCYLDGVNEQASLEALALANLSLNGFDASAGEASFSFGEVGIVDSHWQLSAGGGYQPAGRVSLTSRQPASLMAGGLWGGEIELGAAAAVYKRMAVGFGLGSGLVDIDLTNSLLGALLGGELNVLSYDGLATTRLGLGSLLSAADANGILDADLAVGTVDEVLDSEVALADLLQASIDALDAEGTADVDVRAALVELRDLAVPSGQTLTLSDFLTLATASGETMDNEMQRAALATELDLYGLATGAVYAANQGHFVEIPGLDLDLGIAGLEFGLTIIEPPKYTFGLLPAAADDAWVAQVETAQVALDVSATLLEGGLSLGIPLLLNLTLDAGRLEMQVDVAKARSRLLDAPTCDWSTPQLQLTFETMPSVANLVVASGADPELEGTVNILLGGTATIGVDITADVPVSTQDAIEHTVELSEQTLPYTEEGISAGLGKTLDDTLDGLSLELDVVVLDGSLTSGLLGDVLGLVTGPVLAVAEPLVVSLISSVVEPLLEALGITIGYADVIVVSVEFEGSGLIE